ncbi:hypothetical protein [Thermophilibacter sp.]
MTFTVNPDKKRTWNHGWWRDWAQGRVAIVVACLCAAVLVAVGVYAALTLDPAALAAEARELGSRPETTRLAMTMAASAVLLAGALICAGGVLRHRSAPARQTSAESVTVEGGWLTMRYHRTLDSSPTGQDVAVAWLPGCAWWWDARRRQLVIDARESGAVRDWHYDDPASQPAVAFGDMRPVSFMRLYPFYDPDLLAYLRQTGAPEASPRSAKWEARL